VKQIWTGRVTQAAGRYGEHAPLATVCCNACRTCVTTNIVGIAIAAAGGAGLAAARLARRVGATLNGRPPSTAINILDGEDLLQTFQPPERS
jgi:hypothetical protein